MAERKKLKDKSRPFTTLNHSIPIMISVCGDAELQKTWDSLFSKKNKVKINKSEFLNKNVERDLGDDDYTKLVKEMGDHFWVTLLDRFDRKGLLFTKSEYIRDIVTRAEEENRNEKNRA